MLYITIVAKSPLYLTILYLFFNKIQKNKLINASYIYLNYNSCAVDWKGNTIDFYLSKTREKKAAKHFFKKALQSFYVSKTRVITVDKNPAYPIAMEPLGKKSYLLVCDLDNKSI